MLELVCEVFDVGDFCWVVMFFDYVVFVDSEYVVVCGFYVDILE